MTFVLTARGREADILLTVLTVLTFGLMLRLRSEQSRNRSSIERSYPMASHVVSIGITDFAGDRKTLPLFFPTEDSVATIQTQMNTLLPLLDAVIDGKISDMSIQLSMTLPGGLKAGAVSGNTVHEGANLRYDVAGSDYVHTPYVPSWENAGFAGAAVLATGEYAALEAGIITAGASDKNGLDLSAFISGNRAFRK